MALFHLFHRLPLFHLYRARILLLWPAQISIQKMAMAVISVAVSLSSITSRLGSYSKQKIGVVRKAMLLAV